MTSVTSLPPMSPSTQVQSPSTQALWRLVPAPGVSAPSFEELLAQKEAVEGGPSVATPTFAFSELGMFGLSGAVASRSASADRAESFAASFETPQTETSRTTTFNAPMSTADGGALALPLVGVQAGAPTEVAGGAKSLEPAIEPIAGVDGLEPVMTALAASADSIEAAGPGDAPAEPTPSQPQSVSPQTQTDDGPNADLNLVVSQTAGEAQVAVAAPALPPEAQARLRQVADAVTAEFGLTLTELSFNGAALERAPSLTGAQNAGRFTY